MEKILIPEYEIANLDDVADGVSGARVLFVNVFGVAELTGSWVLVDAGLPYSATRITGWAGERFGEGKKPRAIVLTHAHFDHVGALEDLAELWNVPVYTHAEELPYVTGGMRYPPPDPTVGGGLMSVMSALYPRGPIDLSDRVRPLPADGSVPFLPDWRWIHTPGHTAGHVSFFRDRDRSLIVGDAFCTTKQESFLAVATQRPELHGPPSYYTTDWDSARESVQRLAQLAPVAIAPGHGQPLHSEDVPHRLEILARDFDRVARPERGRYVEHPVKR